MRSKLSARQMFYANYAERGGPLAEKELEERTKAEIQAAYNKAMSDWYANGSPDGARPVYAQIECNVLQQYGYLGINEERRQYEERMSQAAPPPLKPAAEDPRRVAAAVKRQRKALSKVVAKHTSEENWSLRDDVLWVYRNMKRCVAHIGERVVFDFEQATERAPSAGAVALMEWAVDNKNEFFKNMVPKILFNASTPTRKPALADDESAADDEPTDESEVRIPRVLDILTDEFSAESSR